LRRVVVLPTVYENPGQVAIESVDAIRPAMLKVLRTLPNLEVVEIVPAQIEAAGFEFPARRASYRDHEIAAHFGGDLSLRFTNDALGGLLSVSDHWMISIMWKHADGAVGSATEPVPIANRDADVESRGDRVARTVYGQLFPQAARAVWEMVVVDVTQPEHRRLEALSNAQAQNGPEIAPGLADAAVASAIDLARTSADPATRSRVWAILGDYAYPAAREPIIDALLYDPEADVRRIVARALYAYLPDPGVSAALAGASVNDASDAVRLRARWSLMSGRERDAFVHATLRDPGLSDEQKVAPLRFLRRDYDDPLDPASLRMLDEIAVRSADPAVRGTALVELGRSADPGSLDALVDALHNDPDPSVRESALYAMQAHRRDASPDDDRVYIGALLDVVRSDADLPFRTSVLRSLSRDLAAPGVREALEEVLEDNRGNELGAAIEESLGSTRGRNQ
jgi:HEAT repeat protein